MQVCRAKQLATTRLHPVQPFLTFPGNYSRPCNVLGIIFWEEFPENTQHVGLSRRLWSNVNGYFKMCSEWRAVKSKMQLGNMPSFIKFFFSIIRVEGSIVQYSEQL